MANTIELAKKMIDADAEVKSLEAQVKEAKQTRAEISAELSAAMAEDEIQSFKVAGKTVHLRTEFIGSFDNSPEGLEALRSLGAGDMIKEGVNAQTFKAWVKEQIDPDADPLADPIDRLALDEEMKAHLKVYEKTDVRIRKA